MDEKIEITKEQDKHYTELLVKEMNYYSKIEKMAKKIARLRYLEDSTKLDSEVKKLTRFMYDRAGLKLGRGVL